MTTRLLTDQERRQRRRARRLAEVEHEIRQALRRRGRAKRPPSLPKMPWDDEDKPVSPDHDARMDLP
jgi:hypothetical protein